MVCPTRILKSVIIISRIYLVARGIDDVKDTISGLNIGITVMTLSARHLMWLENDGSTIFS